MKQLHRDPSLLPSKLLDNAAKKDYYVHLRNKTTQKIIPRWNTITQNKEQIIRKNLLTISKMECAYCGKRIASSDLDVDHYLPSSQFPYLSYCWENYLPSCKRCNQALKKDYTPALLKGKVLIESCATTLVGHYDCIYNQTTVYRLAGNERLIDPTFDHVEDHLEYNPEFHYYKSKTDIGEKTIEVFFTDIETQRSLEKISIIVRKAVQQGNDWDFIEEIIDGYGSSFYYKKYWEYWIKEKNENRL